MKIDRNMFKSCIAKEEMHNWNCPTCHNGTLEYKDENLNYQEDGNYYRESTEQYYQIPNDIQYRYTLLLKCTNPTCQETVANIGIYEVERYEDYNEYKEIIDIEKHWFTPKYFYPPLHFFQIPEGTPPKVKDTIIEAFSLSFSNYFAAINQIRLALEILMTELGVARTRSNKKGEKIYLPLHERIDMLDEEYEDIKDKCIALKWLGNSGTHGNEKITFDNVLDGYDLLSFIINKLYDDFEECVTKISNELNTNKGVAKQD